MVTLYLYGFSYMSNTFIGPVVSFIHNWADVVISWTRVWAESEFGRVTAYSFLFGQFVWIYTRLFYFPYLIYVSTFYLDVYTSTPYV
jgi:hypothetical protein